MRPQRVKAGSLDGVRWIGGATGAGKSAVALLLAAQFRLAIYDTDAMIAKHSADPGPDAPLLAEFLDQDMDERWLGDPATMFSRFPWFAGERFDHIVKDLELVGGPRLILAEGFRLLPRCVSPFLARPWQAVWLISTPEFRREVFAGRPPQGQFWRDTSNPDLALERLLQRESVFAESVADEARRLGLKTVAVDGARSLSDLAQELAIWLRLPESGPSPDSPVSP